MASSVRSGLQSVSDAPTRGFVEALAGTSTLAGPFAQVDGGVKLLPGLDAFAFGRWTPAESSTGIGARWTF